MRWLGLRGCLVRGRERHGHSTSVGKSEDMAEGHSLYRGPQRASQIEPVRVSQRYPEVVLNPSLSRVRVRFSLVIHSSNSNPLLQSD